MAMKALLFDTETDGLIDNLTIAIDRLPNVLEFYGCYADLGSGEIDQELNLLIKPPKPIPAEVTGITGIDDSMVADAPSFGDVSNQIKLFIESAPLVIAHNLSYDRDVINTEFRRLGQTIAWPPGLCTVEQTIHIKGFRLSLSALHETLFSEPFSGAHRAKVDVQALLRCCVRLYEQGEL
jgi:DNA polymerase-3 subunit epsilon